MSPEATQVPEPKPAGMGAFARITGVFFEPGKTFEDVGQRPTWLIPLLLIVLATMAFTITLGQHIGWDHVVRQQMENSPRVAQLSADQREQAIANGARFASIFAYASAIIVPISYVVISAILLGMTAMMSAGLRFKQVFAVVCYGSLPSVIYSILVLIVMFLKDPNDFNLQNPLAFNVGAALDPQTSSKFLYSLGTSLDLFSFWMMFLMATGLKAAAGKKLSFGGATAAVFVPWAVYVLAKSSLAGLFS